MSRYIDADMLWVQFIYNNPGHAPYITAQDLKLAPTVSVIPTDWIVKQIQSTSGAESSYYARLLHKWRDEHESV